MVGLLGGGAFFALRFGLQRVQESNARTAERIQTNNAEVAAAQTVEALATPTPAPEPTDDGRPSRPVRFRDARPGSGQLKPTRGPARRRDSTVGPPPNR